MPLNRLAGAVLLGLFAVASLAQDAAETESDNSRAGRQWMYPDHRPSSVYQPTVQYFYIDKVQNGPASSEAGLLPRNWEKYFVPYYNSLGLYDAPDAEQANEDDASFRQLNLFGALFNNRFTNGNTNLNTFRPIQNRVPALVRNPDASSLYGSCESASGELGICIPGAACNLYGGRSSGSCRLGSVCCVNTVTRCAATVTLNNTYFQSPSTQPTTPTSCTLTVRLDSTLVEQKQPICQVRLEFLSFTIAQPSLAPRTATLCLTDTFQVGGALNPVPTICGDNDGQHMYLHVPPSNTNPTDLRLTFNFGTSTITRSWNMRIAMLPCNSPSLAPPNCLQYMTAASGRIMSFNWRDVPVAVRQLANQNYKICFRTEIVNTRKANTLCFTECTVTTGNAFLLTGAAGGGIVTGAAGCPLDFIAIDAVVDAGNVARGYDRICGDLLSPLVTTTVADGAVAAPVCTRARPFELLYRTDNTEAFTPAAGQDPDILTEINVGFCLNFQQTAA